MAKYNYDKSVLKGLGVSDFLNEVKVREAHIMEGDNSIPTSIYNPNIVANQLHPHIQFAIVDKVIERKNAKTYVLKGNNELQKNHLAYFRAGQYISVVVQTETAFMSRPYSLCSNPKDAIRNNTYEITVKKNQNGLVSDYILNHWKEGSQIICSGPLGEFYYERLRDQKNVVALAGGSGITPFLSMAKAIAEGIEDFNLTILYGSNTEEEILFKDELDECVKKAPEKIKVVHILSKENKEGFETGFVDVEKINRYAPDNYSIFVCGPKGMYDFLNEELKKLNLPKRKIRFELPGEYGDPTGDENYPEESKNKDYQVKVWFHGECKEFACAANETLMRAIERNNIKVTTDCRSGQCGWCHSRLISGSIYIPDGYDGRRLADRKFGWIHPCASYPTSDIEMEVFPID